MACLVPSNHQLPIKIMKHFLALLCCIFCPLTVLLAQSATLSGTVKDAVSGESLIGATVKIGEAMGAVTDIDGNYTLAVADGTHQISVSYIGYKPDTFSITIANSRSAVRNVLLREDSQTMQEVEVVADVARSRETPVAFSTISVTQIKEENSRQDLPMLLNSKPGIYATQQGGGDGDARISIRGFDQRNTASLIDGIPVNDMENGEVYWSNWSALNDVTRSMQVQRGLGASKLALPSVGGTINVLTKGIESKRELSLRQEVGGDGYLKTALMFNTGRLKGGWGATGSVSYRRGDGWVDNTWVRAWSYFVKVEKQLGKHLISLSALGAPQEHGQRSFKQLIATFDKEYARDFFGGTDTEYDLLRTQQTAITQLETQRGNGIISEEAFFTQLDTALGINTALYDRYNNEFIDTSNARNYGTRYNPHWGVLNRYSLVADGDTAFAETERVSERYNKYHKPQFTLRHFWSPNNRFSWSNIAYLSIGQGGGYRANVIPADLPDGLLNFQKVYDTNMGAFGDTTLHSTSNAIYMQANNHFWYGFLSTFDYNISPQWSLSGGIDARDYTGEHYAEVSDLLGGDFFFSGSNIYDTSIVQRRKVVGDKMLYNYDGLVRWGGIFAQLEYKNDRFSTFLNLTSSASNNARRDYFRPKDIVLSDTVIAQVIGAKNGVLDGKSYYKQFEYNGVLYDINSPEVRDSYSETGWLFGYTAKTGANYNISERLNVFFNTGYLSRVPPLRFFFNEDNAAFSNVKNEEVIAAELGSGYKSPKFALNLNAYYTRWNNRPTTASVRTDPTDPDIRETRNIAGLKAIYRGVELDFAYHIIKNRLTWEGTFSLGDWVWDTDANSVIVGGDNDDQLATPFSAKGVHVGNAAQFQLGSTLRYEPIKGLFLKGRWMYFGKNYSDFQPERLTGINEDREAWQLPDYSIVDLFAGYKFKLDKMRFILNAGLLNALNTTYISDASTRIGFNLDQIEVFFGQGRRWTASLEWVF